MLNQEIDKNFRFSVLRCYSAKEIKEKLAAELEEYADLFPSSKSAKILLKPNLNSYMNALTGNTTDLRILAALLEYLKDKGYNNITIGEGTSSGFYREKINIFSRLRVDKLADFYKVKLLDLNYAPSEEVEFEHGIRARVAKICQEADFFINLPKIKTHFEAQMSVCLKNMMGTLVGLPNKQKTHRSLFKNILNLNKYVKPHLHIVDGLIAMEGNGPSSGTPKRLDFIFIGTNPYLIDLACAKVAGFVCEEVPYLKIARERGIITKPYSDFVNTVIPDSFVNKLRRPKVSALVSFVNNPKWQHYIVKIRLAPGISWIFSTKLVGALLNFTGLRQDVFLKEDADCGKIIFFKEECTGCGKCAAYCPLWLDLSQGLKSENKDCIGCLYCFLVCPKHAIGVEGKLGFFAEQIRRYDKITRSIA